MSVKIGETAPDFKADTTTGPISFHDWADGDWVFFFSHPADFTPVCTPEMGRTTQLAGQFAARGVKPLGLSTDDVSEHLKWIEDVNETQSATLAFPIVAHPDLKIAKLYEMIRPTQSETGAVRSVFIIDPDKKVRLTMTYPKSVGRNFDEILRAINALQAGGPQPDRDTCGLTSQWKGHHPARHRRCRNQDAVPARLDGTQTLSPHDPHSGYR